MVTYDHAHQGGLIPCVVHFVHGLATSADDVQFGYEHYLAVVAASVHIRPRAIVFHHYHRPRGEWWDRAAPLLELRQINLPTEVFGRPLVHAAHRADVVRLRALLREGGIYLDMDVIALRSFDSLLAEPVPALGLEGRRGEHGLCNAVLVSPAGAPFLARWLEAYRSFNGSQWAEHSVSLPLRLARAHPSEVRTLAAEAFFWPLWDDSALRQLLLYNEYDFKENFAAHLWSQVARPYVLSLWSPAFVASVPSALNCRLRQLLRAHASEYPPAGSEVRGGGAGAAAAAQGCGCARARAAPAGALPTPIHRWPLVERHAFGHGGDAEGRTLFCFAADTAAPAPQSEQQQQHSQEERAGGCAHLAFFARGCAATDEEEEGGAAASAAFRPYLQPQPAAGGAAGLAGVAGGGGRGGGEQLVDAHASDSLRALRWRRGLEGFAAVSGSWQSDFTITWLGAAQLEGVEGAARDGGAAMDEGGARVWWSLVLAGGGQLSATLDRPLGDEHGVPQPPAAAAAREAARPPAREAAAAGAAGVRPAALLEPVVWAAGHSLASAPLPCAGLRSGARGVAADGAWHRYAVHAVGGRLWLEVDGQLLAHAHWAPSEEARVVGLWVGTAEPSVAGRSRPTHEPSAAPGAGAARPREGARAELELAMASLEVFAPSLRSAAGRASADPGGSALRALMGDDAPPPLVELPAVGWRAAARAAPCDAAASARAAPLTAALVALACLGACALLARALSTRHSSARARYRRMAGGAAGLAELGKAN